MVKRIIKNQKSCWIIVALGIFTSSLFMQTNLLFLVVPLNIFLTLCLYFIGSPKTASISFFISFFFVLWTVAGWHLYDPLMITHWEPIVLMRTGISNFYDRIYGQNSDAAIFFKLVLLNIKSYDGTNMYVLLRNLSVVHLFVISGFHLNFLFWILTFWYRGKKKWIVNYFAFFVCAFYGLILNLTFGILRSLLTLFMGKILCKFRLRGEQKLTIAITTIIFLNPTAVTNIGFQLSCLGTLGCISGINTKNKLLNNFFVSFFVMFLVAPIIIVISQQFNIFSFILIFFFAPFFYFFIFYAWFFSWMSFLYPIGSVVVSVFLKFLFFIYAFKAMIVIQKVNYLYLIIYYCFVLMGCIVINLEYKRKYTRLIFR